MSNAVLASSLHHPRPWDAFTPVDLEALKRCALLRRRDTKFLISQPQLTSLMRRLRDDYGILLAGGQPLATYETLYFDTPDLAFYETHRRGKRPRWKVRVRHYPERRQSFLEVKRKSNHNITTKTRWPKPYGDNTLLPDEQAAIAELTGIDATSLRPQVWTNFNRITLVGEPTQERVTINLNLEYRRQDLRRPMGSLVIVEVKQPRFVPRTPVMLALRAGGVRPFSASKYCTATILGGAPVRHNRFRPVLRRVERLSHA